MKEGRLWRLLKILRLVSSGTHLKAGEIAEELGVSRRTFHRDREVLERVGIPIVFDGSGYTLVGPIFLPAVHLRWDEGLALLVTLRAALHSGGTPFSESLRGAMEKIESGIPPSVKGEIQDAVRGINVETRPVVDMSEHGDTFDALWTACRDNEAMDIRYWGRSDSAPETREVEPLAIFHRWRAWYLVAHCRVRDDLRTFRIDRVVDWNRTGERFVPPKNFDLDAFLSEAWLVERGQVHDVEIAFTGLAARLVTELRWHPSQEVRKEGPDRVIASFQTGGLNEVAEWVLSFGGDARVIAPLELSDMVRETASSILSAHQEA